MILKPVLYVEDDENDVFLMQRAFRLSEISQPLRIAPDGKAAVEYMNQVFSEPENPAPCLVVLDLSMPGKNGLDVLKWIRNESSHVAMPVLVFTSSNQESDINRAFQLRANGFITKPGDPNKLIKIVKAVKQYWLVDPQPAQTFADFAAASQVRVLLPRPEAGETGASKS